MIPATPSGAPCKDWAVLVYLEGRDHLGESTLRALNELEKVGSTDGVDVVCQATVVPAGRSERRRLGKPWSRRFHVLRDEAPDRVTSPAVEELAGPVPLTAASLSDFLSWAIPRYPARHVLVVVKKHGQGPAADRGVPLSAPEMKAALQSARARTGTPIDVVAWDGCSLETIEVAYELRGQAGVMTGSPGDILASEYPYKPILADLAARAAEHDASSVGRMIVDVHRRTLPYQIESAARLDRVEAVAPAVRDLVDRLIAEGIPRDLLYTHLMNSPSMNPYESQRPQFDFRDLGSFVHNLSQDPRLASPAVKDALARVEGTLKDSLLAHHVHPTTARVREGTGFSAFLPWQRQPSREKEYATLDYARDSHWNRLLDYIFEGPTPPRPPRSLPHGLAPWAFGAYKRYVSPYLGRACYYDVSCSQYALDAVSTQGLVEGSKMAFMRFISCNRKQFEAHGEEFDLHDAVPGHCDHGQPEILLSPPTFREKSRWRRRCEGAAIGLSRLGGALVGGGIGAALGALGGLAFGTFTAWKAGTGQLDAYDNALVPRYGKPQVERLLELQHAVADPAARIRRSLSERPCVAKVVGGLVGGSAGTVLGALGGAFEGRKWGARFGGLLAQNYVKDVFEQLPRHPRTEAVLAAL